MAGLKAKRNAALRARIDALRALGPVMGRNGHAVPPDSPDYEKMLKQVAGSLTDSQVQELANAQGS